MSVRIAPYGSWESPIGAAMAAAGSHPVEAARFVGAEIWWSERRPSEGGRNGVYRRDRDGRTHEVLAAPASVRSRVHEYGGGAWTTTTDARLVYVEARDQRIRIIGHHGEPVALTPKADGVAYGELSVHGDSVLAVRERVREGGVDRDIVLVPLDGAAAADPERIVSVVSGAGFVAYPRFSPDGTRLAWIAWEHPRMPWDGTELRVGAVGADGGVGEWTTLLGGPEESVLQPEWRDSGSLWAVTDRSGFWNPVLASLAGGSEPLLGDALDVGGPLWNLGLRCYLPLDDGSLLLRSTFGDDRLELLDSTGERRPISSPFTAVDLYDAVDGRVLMRAAGPAFPAALVVIDVASGAVEVVRSEHDEVPDAAYLSEPVSRTFRGPDREVHAVVHPPRNPRFEGPAGELPPYVAIVHGGPTAHSQASVNLAYSFYTSRGIGVIDVNYGGSTGFGREYRERLRGRWGVVDVVDVEVAVRALAEAGDADPNRLAIEGSSAGGWTVLSALVRGDAFACGVSLYGVADARSLVESTHDFEASYLDGLIGPLPDAAAVYDERSPLSGVDGLDRPVLLLQGLDDPVVPPSQSEAFRDALVRAGVPHAYLTFEGESHGFRRAETRIRVREAALSFYGQVLGFDTPGIPVVDLWRPTSRSESTGTPAR